MKQSIILLLFFTCIHLQAQTTAYAVGDKVLDFSLKNVSDNATIHLNITALVYGHT